MAANRYLARQPGRFKFGLLAILFGGFALTASAESEYAAAWGPSVGTTAPLLEGTDQDGNAHTLATLRGSNGLLFVFNRSVDW